MIVACWSSKHLLELIYSSGGSRVRNAVNQQLKHHWKSALTSVECDGDIQSKKIYFLHWEMKNDFESDRKSLEDLINISMKKASEENYRKIVYPAIGCGEYNYSPQLIAQTMIHKCHQQQSSHQISVSILIEPKRKDLLEHFQRQISLLSSTTDFYSTNICNSVIQIEKGDINKQKVIRFIWRRNLFCERLIK